MLISTAFFAPPLQSRAEPTILATLIGGVASLFGVDFFSCSFNILFYCDSSGNVIGSDGGGSVIQDACTSAPNSCGQTNTGFLSGNGSVCSATPPPNSTCPTPSIGGGDFYAQPSIIGVGMSSTLHWTASNATACTITSDNGFTPMTAGSSGSVSTGSITASGTYTLTCKNGDGGPQGSASIRVVVDPNFKEI